MNNYHVSLTRNETLSIIAGLQRELDFQNEQAAMYRRNSSTSHFGAYHNRLKQRADRLIDKLLALPGMEEANNQALLDSVGREPEFVVALALKCLDDEKRPKEQYTSVASTPENTKGVISTRFEHSPI